MRFSARYDTATRIVSAVSSAVLVGAAAASRSLIIAPLSLIVLALAYGFSPTGYSISEGSLLIRRPFGSVRIPLEGIRLVRAAIKDDFQGCVRLFGSGGLFGYYGRFRTSNLGTCTWYMTDRSKAVVIDSSKGTVLISPEDREGFLSAIKSVQPSAQTGVRSNPVISAPMEPPPGFPVKWVILITVIALAIAFGAMFYRTVPVVAVSANAITIHDPFNTVTLRAGQIDVPGIRVVDLDAEPAWRATLKIRGFSNPFYRSGFFRSASGQRVELFTGRATRLVLLPPRDSGTPVLVEAAHPDELAADIQRALSH